MSLKNSQPTNPSSQSAFLTSRLNGDSWLVYLGLLIIALLPRLPGLDSFLTSDEQTNIYLAGSDVIAAFLRGDFRGTYWHFYPGVTMSWLDAVGLIGQYGFDWLTGVPVPPLSDYLYRDLRSLMVAARLPYALLTAAAVPLVYGLARQLLPPAIALLGALFLAFDPFFLAHSRVVHGDAPVAVFMTLSLLSLLIYFHSPLSFPFPFSLLSLSAISGGLAALTKAPGQFMALFMVGLTVGYAIVNWPPHRRPIVPHLATYTLPVVIWGLVSLMTFIILWPAMWVDPAGTIHQMLAETFGKVNEGHLVYFWGEPTLDPGPWFYPYVIPFRLTPLTLLGCLFAGLMLIWPGRSTKPLGLLWLYVISLLIFGLLSPKKQDRYLLPLFPILDLLAAIGWLGLLELIIQFRPFQNRRFLRPTMAGFLLLLHSLPVITYYPYYLAYFNPLMGGPSRASQTTLMGWGEGMAQAAAYLNRKPSAAELYVASTPSQTFLPYFVGQGENFYTNDIAFRADYVILYLAQRQRFAPSPEIVRYFEAQTPEKVIFIQDVPYVAIYRNQKRILSDIPADAIPLNIGLETVMRLAGYQLSKPTPSEFKLTLYWHALSDMQQNYTISVRLVAADGRWLIQRDSWPVAGLLPTSQWRWGDYVADTHHLDLSAAEEVAGSHFEVVVYETESLTPLGSSIKIEHKE